MSNINYNERSWAIDVISEINKWADARSVILKRAGGENTIKSKKSSLFPDVLLFGDKSSGLILQGWELKMPDTPLTDSEFIGNAREKADILSTKSFLLWNVTGANLYKIDENGDHDIVWTWNNLCHIRDRRDVQSARSEWIQMLHNILDDLVEFFNDDTIKSGMIIDSLTGKGVTDIILSYSDSVSDNLYEKSNINSTFNDKVILWWKGSGKEYLGIKKPWKPLANLILISWVNKLIFAHVLKHFHSNANLINNISGDIGIEESIEIMNKISEKCDFWNIFMSQLGEEYITDSAWKSIVSFNELLIDMRIEDFDQRLIQDLLRFTVLRSRRKVAGQFTTPKELAAFLAVLTITNKTKEVLDPCCGTGSISRASYDFKVSSGIDAKNALKTTWSSDKFRFPLQMATLAITSPESMGELIRIFKEDATNLYPNKIIKLHNPNDGSEVVEKLPKMGAILSNLPFVQQEDIDIVNPNIKLNINSKISNVTKQQVTLNCRSDLYAYLPFSLWTCLEEKGRMGIIISNSWLATTWGENFYSLLNTFFNIETIVTSGNGRWFDNADIVTNILILNKRSEDNIKKNYIEPDEVTTFITLNKTIKDISTTDGYIDYNKLSEIVAEIRVKEDKYSNLFTKTFYNTDEIDELESSGLSKNALFSNCKWIFEVKDKLIRASSLFNIARGERRGWDKMFYPCTGHGIENDYIRPVIKTARDIKGYLAKPQSQAFCCEKSISELEALGHNGVVNWIRNFENEVNGTGKPLTEVLKKKGIHWYTMLPNTMADIVISINPGDRLFYSRLEDRSFVNQRLVRFTSKEEDTNIKLCSALLNSILGLFYIEALGFGRGLGALDLSATKMKTHLFMLNPNLLTSQQVNEILDKYAVIESRSVLDIKEELSEHDRNDFDNTVLQAFGILKYKDDIRRSLLTLYKIRKSVGR